MARSVDDPNILVRQPAPNPLDQLLQLLSQNVPALPGAGEAVVNSLTPGGIDQSAGNFLPVNPNVNVPNSPLAPAAGAATGTGGGPDIFSQLASLVPQRPALPGAGQAIVDSLAPRDVESGVPQTGPSILDTLTGALPTPQEAGAATRAGLSEAFNLVPVGGTQLPVLDPGFALDAFLKTQESGLNFPTSIANIVNQFTTGLLTDPEAGQALDDVPTEVFEGIEEIPPQPLPGQESLLSPLEQQGLGVADILTTTDPETGIAEPAPSPDAETTAQQATTADEAAEVATQETIDGDTAATTERQNFFQKLQDDELNALLMGIGTSLLQGKDIGTALQTGLLFTANTRNQRIRNEAAAAQADAAAAQEQRAADESAAEIQLKQAQAEKALADAAAATNAAAAEGDVSNTDYAKLVADTQQAIEENIAFAGIPVPESGVQFESVFRVNSLLPEPQRRKIPFTATDQERLRTIVFDQNMTQEQVVNELQRAEVVYGQDVINTWLRSLGPTTVATP